ncbi:tRNA pseudouridine synthase B [Thermocrinis albus DSM 14484]|uniref:tRNA pseudouridine synthase B n=1 Tax=Thermocrinis albus (strain DSM 14484 / JCM 11386 / HI 11/12) TaxID=638303 RepID=D3SN00_THEAH|nr:tRNA pseudouridine(55) synthase TruB [Thermocrinis albus]ADC90130.1 tRNA pseudouridine synthase B [Thermocrinis albus DSM 14484]
MIPGILLVDKPKGITSMKVVEEIKRKFRFKKAGHTGTLDPIATGLLIVLVEEATRYAEFFQRQPKTYETVAVLGQIRDTYDEEGKVLEEREVKLSCEDVEKALEKFRGRILQKPPLYSAKKLGGIRAHQYARRGVDIELKAVEVEVYRAQVLECHIPVIKLLYTVSSGTYVRSLVHDLGMELGCGAYVKDLRRTAVGNFSVSMAISFERLMSLEDVMGVLIPIWDALQFLPAVYLSGSQARPIKNGNAIHLKTHFNGYVRLFEGEEFLGVGLIKDGLLKPYRLMPLKVG